MFRLILFILVAIIIAHLTGCGSSSGGSSQAVSINIQNTRFIPKTITISVGNRVQWTNIDVNPHKIVSGTLLGTTTPITRTPIIQIQQDNTFSPPVFSANLGDTIRFQNNRSSSFSLDIVNDAGNVVSSLTFSQSGQVQEFSGFPTAGFYTYQQTNNPLFKGAITVFGTPNPNGAFVSQTLGQGGTFTTQFNTAGVFPYFDLNQADPNQSFITGTIVVQ